MQLPGAGALVVGGASGLGEATARRLSADGALVTIADVDERRGQALADELGASFVVADVTDSTALQHAVDTAARSPTGLRISVACAGIGWVERTLTKTGPHEPHAFERVIAVNLVGSFNVLRLAAAAMAANEPSAGGERGVCVNTASVAAYEGQVGQVAYSASKGGVVGMTLPAARDLASLGIRVCAIAPGPFDTPLLAQLPPHLRDDLVDHVPFPRRLGRPDEFAALVAHIAENEMLNGEVIRLDGGARMPPR